MQGDKTLGELASVRRACHPDLGLEEAAAGEAAGLFEDRRRSGVTRSHQRTRAVRADRPPEDGGRVVEKKICPVRLTCRRTWIERGHGQLSLRRQCELLGLARGSWYYEPAGETAENLELMRRIDELYLKRPYFGSRRIADRVRRESQARATADAGHGPGGDLPQAADDGAVPGTQDLPVFAAECGDRAAESGLEHRHHVHPLAGATCT